MKNNASRCIGNKNNCWTFLMKIKLFTSSLNLPIIIMHHELTIMMIRDRDEGISRISVYIYIYIYK